MATERKTISLSLSLDTISFLDSLKIKYGTATRSAAFEIYIKDKDNDKYNKDKIKEIVIEILSDLNFDTSKNIDMDKIDDPPEVEEDDMIAKSMDDIFATMVD